MGRRTRIIVACALLVACAIPALRTPAGADDTTVFDVRTFGAKGDGVTDDTVAIQFAMDLAGGSGGGRVHFPAGTYRVRSLYLNSDVEIFGNGDAVLKTLDPHRAMVYAESVETTGSIAKGSNILNVTSPYGLRPGLPIAIAGAGQRIAHQTTSDPMLYSKVTSVSGNTVKLANGALATVSNAYVRFGITGAAIRGLVFDGAKDEATEPTAAVPLDMRQTGGTVIANNVIRNGVHGAIRLDLGSRGNVVANNQLVNNGRPKLRMGAAIWLFRGANKNVIRGNRISGTTYLGIAIDDRTEQATEWDAASNRNFISRNRINFPSVNWNSGIYIGGSSSNLIDRNRIRGVLTGVAIERSWQGANGRDARYNAVKLNSLSRHGTGISVSGSRNKFVYNKISSTTTRVVNTGSRNSFR